MLLRVMCAATLVFSAFLYGSCERHFFLLKILFFSIYLLLVLHSPITEDDSFFGSGFLPFFFSVVMRHLIDFRNEAFPDRMHFTRLFAPVRETVAKRHLEYDLRRQFLFLSQQFASMLEKF